MLMSVGSSTSCMPVIELTVVPPSLIESLAMCEWQSMMPGRDELPGHVHDVGAGRDVDVGAHCRDLPVAEEDGAVLDGAPRHGHDRAALERNRARLPRGLAGGPRAGDRHEHQCRTQRDRPSGEISAFHVNLH